MNEKTIARAAGSTLAIAGTTAPVLGSAVEAQTTATVQRMNTIGRIAEAALSIAPSLGPIPKVFRGFRGALLAYGHNQSARRAAESTVLTKFALRNAGTLLKSAGVIRSPAWAGTATRLGGAAAVIGLAITAYQYREEIADAAATATQWVRQKLNRTDDNGPEFVS